MLKPKCRTLLHGLVPALGWGTICPVLVGTLQAPAHPDSEAAARAEAAKYRGVSYHKRNRNRPFVALLWARGRPGYIGSFKTAKQAAEARDQAVRSLYPGATPDHKFQCKKLLNFPSREEASYNETTQQARRCALKIHGANTDKADRRSMEMLQKALNTSLYSDKYELVRLTESAKADALLKLRGSSQAGLPIQIKAATSRWSEGRKYHFNHLLAYDGMLVVLVALDGGYFWVATGEEFKADDLWITIGCESDTDRPVENIVSHLVACLKDTQQFPHLSVEEAEHQCSASHRLEVAAHRQLRNLFSCMNWSLSHPDEHGTTVLVVAGFSL